MRFIFTSLIILINTNLIGQIVELNTEESFNGYTLFSPLNSTDTYLIDNCGFLINSWSSLFRPGLSVYLLEDGSLLRTCKVDPDGPKGGRIEKYSWNGELTWEFDFCDTDVCQHHDIEFLPNGNLLILASEIFDITSTQEAGFDSSSPTISEMIIEINPNQDNEIVWEWHAFDHLVNDNPQMHQELIWTGLGNQNSNPSGTDWLHANSIDYNQNLDQIILSVRACSEIWIIDHSTTIEEAANHNGGDYGMGGDLIYRWGNPNAYNLGSNENQLSFKQHDANWIPEGYEHEGDIMIFNNGTGRGWSSVDIISPPMDENNNYIVNQNEIIGPEILTWTYEAEIPTTFFSNAISGSTRLENSNTIICEGGPEGMGGARIFEVDLEGNIVWDFHNYGNGNVFRVYKYGPEYPGLIDKDLTPGQNLSISPNACNIYGCTDINACNYNQFANQNDLSCLYIGDLCDDGNTNTVDDQIQENCECDGTINSALDEVEALSIIIYPNPTSNNLTIDLGDLNGLNTCIKLYDVSRKLVFKDHTTSTLNIDVSGFAKGLYIVKLSTDENVAWSQVIID